MKRIISLILIVSLVATLLVCFVACNKDEDHDIEYKYDGKTGYTLNESFEDGGKVVKYVDGQETDSFVVNSNMVSNFDTTDTVYKNWTANIDGTELSFPYFVTKEVSSLGEATSVTNNVYYYADIAYGNKLYDENDPTSRLEDSSQIFDAYIPESVLSGTLQNPNVLLYVHGGAWMVGSKTQEGADFCQEMAENGFITVTMNYVMQKMDTLLAGEIYEEGSLTNMVGDIGIMVTYLKGFLKKNFNYEPESIAIGGLSAGGHLSTLYAYQMGDYSPIHIGFELDIVGPTQFADAGYRAFLGQFLVESSKLKGTNAIIGSVVQEILPSALAAFEGVDVEYIKSIGGIDDNSDVSTWDLEAMWNSTEQYSSLTYVSSSSCPTIMAYGKMVEDEEREKSEIEEMFSMVTEFWPDGVENDLLVPCTCYYELDKALTNAGVYHVAKLFEGESHITMNNSEASRAWIVEQTIAFAELYL